MVAIFEDGTDIYFARQQINERLGEAQLPEDIERPTMGPVATGLGEVYHYILSSNSPDFDLTELRSLQDWVIRPRLRRVPGVAEVNPWGGLAKQFEARADPIKLAKYNLTLDDVILALRENNKNVGGGYVVRSDESSLIQGVGRARTADEVAKIVITAKDGVPIRVGDVGEVAIGHAIRRGGSTANGKGEVVLGLAFMRMGENSRDVTIALEKAMDEIRSSLPKDEAGRPLAQITTVYERTTLVDQVLRTVERNLFEGAVLVIAVLFAFLGNFRAGLIVALAIPLSMLFAVTMMERVGIAGSLMSLGAIDFGLVVDSSVVMAENCLRRLAHDRSGRSKLEIIREAAVEVRKPTMFGELIIMIVYLPILTLQGIEGKLFRPMALTVVFALAGSMVMSLTLMPGPGLARPVPQDAGPGDDHRQAGPRVLPADPPPGPALPQDDPRLRRDGHAGGHPPGPDPGLGVRPQAGRRDDRHQHDPPGQHQPGGVAGIRDAGRGAPQGGVPGRDRPGLEPHRDRRGRHRSDGLRGHRRLRHAQVA